MKKNLRIVSAAAAALLAVSPVVASAVNVNAAGNTLADSITSESKQSKFAYVTGAPKGAYLYKTSLSGTDATGKAYAPEGKVASPYTPISIKDGTQVEVPANADTKADASVWRLTGGSSNKIDHHQKLVEVIYNGKKYYMNASQLTYSVPTTATTPADSSSTSINASGNSATTIFDVDGNTLPTIHAVAADNNGHAGSVNGGITVNLNGKSYNALLHSDGAINGSNTTILDVKGNKVTDFANLKARTPYTAVFNDVTINLGADEAGKTETFTLPSGSWFSKPGTGAKLVNGNDRVLKATVDANGIAHLGEIRTKFYAYDAQDMKGINFYAVKTGETVTSGSLNMHTVNVNGKAGQLNVESVYAALNAEYGAAQVFNDSNRNLVKPLTLINDIKSQLEKANIKVDDNGYFTAPSSFKINLSARSNANGAEATLPVTVNVDNAAASTTPTAPETTKSVTIMHISTIYDKNGVATHEPALRAYNSVSVVSDPVTINGAKFYKLAGKDQYIKVGNVDGTSRTLKHNAYVYKSNGKARMASKKHHVVRKSGASVTTYGKSFMIAGHQMYRVGRNQYIKVANFR